VPERFGRDYGCTEAEWLRWLPEATPGCTLALPGPGQARVGIGGGHLDLRWAVLPPRQIALMRLPRLQVDFVFEEVADAARANFMRVFDLSTQRGGG
jgi:hypothetical protein